ncbi:MAG: hypothetical protein ACERKN_06590 [Velocimicrobium sp.]
MKILEMKDNSENVTRLGRTYDGLDGAIFMNWTCSGLRFKFKGTCLIANLNAIYGEETDNCSFDGSENIRKTWPYAAVFIDNKEEPERYFEVSESTKNYLLFLSEKEEIHIVTIRKMTENPKGKLSLRS